MTLITFTNLSCAPNPRMTVVTNQLTCYVRKDHLQSIYSNKSTSNFRTNSLDLERPLLLVVVEQNPPELKDCSYQTQSTFIVNETHWN